MMPDDGSMAFWRRSSKESPADRAGRRADEAVHLADAGHREEALVAAGEAVEQFRSLAVGAPEAYRARLALALDNLGGILLLLERAAAARPVVEEAIALLRRPDETGHSAHQPDLAKAMLNLSTVLGRLGRHAEAVATAREAVEIQHESAMDDPDRYLLDYTHATTNFALVLSRAGCHDEATTVAQQAVMRYRRMLDNGPDDVRPWLPVALTNLGVVLTEQNRHEEAVPFMTEAVERYRDLVGTGESYRAKFGESLYNLGISLAAIGDRDSALKVNEAALLEFRWAAHTDPDYLHMVATALETSSLLLSEMGRPDDAALDEASAVELRETLRLLLPGADSPDEVVPP
jgi:tetratricopeptide (TPR) repeat protein